MAPVETGAQTLVHPEKVIVRPLTAGSDSLTVHGGIRAGAKGAVQVINADGTLNVTPTVSDGSVTFEKWADNDCTAGEIAQWVNSTLKWECTSVSGAGGLSASDNATITGSWRFNVATVLGDTVTPAQLLHLYRASSTVGIRLERGATAWDVLTNTNLTFGSGANIPLTLTPAGGFTLGVLGQSGTVHPATTFSGDVTINGQVNSDLIPEIGDQYDVGSPERPWSQAWFARMNAVLFAEATATLFGGYSIIGPNAGVLGAETAAGASPIDLGKTGVCEAAPDCTNRWIVIRAHDTAGDPCTEYMELQSESGTSYSVLRNRAGSTGTCAFGKGTPWLYLGPDGRGRIELNAYTSPRISLIRQGNTSNGATEVARFGALSGYCGTGFGFAIGDACGAGNSLLYDAVTGVLTLKGNGGGITSIDGSKITTGTIDASVVTVSNINAGNISTGTLTGRTVETGSTGARVVLNTDPSLKWYDANGEIGSIDSTGMKVKISPSGFSSTAAYNFTGWSNFSGSATTASLYATEWGGGPEQTLALGLTAPGTTTPTTTLLNLGTRSGTSYAANIIMTALHGSTADIQLNANTSSFFLAGEKRLSLSGSGITMANIVGSGTQTFHADLANHRVGIGTTSPTSGYALDVNGAVYVRGGTGLTLTGNGGTDRIENVNSSGLGFDAQNGGGRHDLLIYGGGYLYTHDIIMGFTSGTGRDPTLTTYETDQALIIDPNGAGRVYFNGTDIQLNGAYNNAGSWPASGGSTTLCDNGGWIYRCTTSSARYKTDIVPATFHFNRILDVEPVTFRLKNPPVNPDGVQAQTGLHFGLIAEEVEALGLTPLVRYEQGRVEAVEYDKVALYLIPVVREQRDRIAALEARLALLESK